MKNAMKYPFEYMPTLADDLRNIGWVIEYTKRAESGSIYVDVAPANGIGWPRQIRFATHEAKYDSHDYSVDPETGITYEEMLNELRTENETRTMAALSMQASAQVLKFAAA